MARADTRGDDTFLATLVDELLAIAMDPDRDRVKAIRAAIPRSAASPADRLKVFPSAPMVRLVLAVASPPHFQALVESHPDLADRLTVARDFVMMTFPELEFETGIPITELTKSANDPVRMDDFLRGLQTIGHANVWSGEPGRLVPAVKLVITDETAEPVLDRFVSWTDLLFLAESALTALKDSVSAGSSVVETEMVGEFLESLPAARSRIAALLQDVVDAAGHLSDRTR